MSLKKICIFLCLCLSLSGTKGIAQEVQSVASVEIQGNTRTKSAYLERFIEVEAGMKKDSAIIQNDLRRLRNLPSVMSAEVIAENSDSSVRLIYQVEERLTLFPVGDFGITEGNFWAGAGAMESNLSGRGLYIYGYYQYNILHSTHLIFRNPYLFASPWGVELEFKNLPSFERSGDSLRYQNQLYSFRGAIRYEPKLENQILIGLAYRKDIAQDFQLANMDPPPVIDLQRSSVEFSIRYEIRKLDYNGFYIRGWKNEMLLSTLFPLDNEFNRAGIFYNEFSAYQRTGTRGNVAIRFIAGLSSEKTEFFQPFIADSYYNLRGIGYRIFRGNEMAVMNLEYRHTLYENPIGGIQATLFIDSGYLNDSKNQLHEAYLHMFSGAGIRIIYKKAYNAILCIDYGFNARNPGEGGWVIGWGQYF